MSTETLEWLNNNVLVGFTSKRGNAWHYKESEQGAEPNHYPDAIPVGDVVRRLFSWEPVSLPVYVAVPCSLEDAQSIGPDGQPIRFVLQEDRQAIAANDNFDILGMFKDGYTPHPYAEWLLGNVTNLLMGEVGIGSAGLLKNRAQAWVQVEVPETLQRHGVKYRPNLLAASSLDGSLASLYKRTVGVVVCDNTLSAAIGERSDAVRIKHTRNSNLRLDDAKQALGILEQTAEDFDAQLDRLIGWDVTATQFAKALEQLVPLDKDASDRSKGMVDRKRSMIRSLYNHDERASTWKGTAFGVLQAFNTFETHQSIVRGAERVERNMSNVLSGKSFDQDAEVLKVLATV